jgi:hypothetical protein
MQQQNILWDIHLAGINFLVAGIISIPQLREAHFSIVYNQFTIRTCVTLRITLLPLPE